MHANSSVCVCEAVAVTLTDIQKFVTCRWGNFLSQGPLASLFYPPVHPLWPLRPWDSLAFITLILSMTVRRAASTDIVVSALFIHFNRDFRLNVDKIVLVSSSGQRQNSSYCHLNHPPMVTGCLWNFHNVGCREKNCSWHFTDWIAVIFHSPWCFNQLQILLLETTSFSWDLHHSEPQTHRWHFPLRRKSSVVFLSKECKTQWLAKYITL